MTYSNLYYYVHSLAEKRIISSAMEKLVMDTCGKLDMMMGYILDVPDAGPGADGSMMLAWLRNNRRLEVEFVPGSDPTVFYHDPAAGISWEAPLPAKAPVSKEILSKLKLFVTTEHNQKVKE